MSKMRFSKRKLHFLFLSILCWRHRNRKKRKWKRPINPIKIVFFEVVMQKCEKSKIMDILQKLPDTICVRKGEKKRAFSCTLSVLAQNFLGPKQCKPGKTIKIVVSAEIGQNQK